MEQRSSSDYSALDRPEVLMFLFHPRKEIISPNPLKLYKDIMIPVEEDIRIGARFLMGGAVNPNILFFHGNGEIVSDYDDLGPLYNKLGLNLLAADYRGYGRSDGSPTVSAMMEDAKRIFEFTIGWLKDHHYTGPLIVMGRSLGSASALELAAAFGDKIDGLIIESGFAWAAPLLRLLGVNPDAIGFNEEKGFANIDKIKTFDKPTLVIHAEFDHIIPFSDGNTLYEASPADARTLLKIPGANHNDIFLRGINAYLEAVKNLADGLTA